jgi:hypothetical protein
VGQVPGPVERWARWDADLLRKVAEHGYASDAYDDVGIEAFFPGFPLLLRAVHVVVPDWTAAGLVVSLVASAVACVALARLAALEGLDGGRAVLFLVASPWAVFLAAGYSEALFLALALPGWLAARSGGGRWRRCWWRCRARCGSPARSWPRRWWCSTWWRTAGRPRWDAAWLLLPGVALVGYAAYLRSLTGDWLRWFAAQEQGWDRRLTWPWDAFEASLAAARSGTLSAQFVVNAWFEIGAVLLGVALTVLLVVRRRWAEAVYVGLSVGALATSTFYLSVARSSLLWFPLYLALAAAAARWRWVVPAYLALAAPLMLVGVVVFTSGRWWG